MLTALSSGGNSLDAAALRQVGLQLPEPDEGDWRALLDEAMATILAPDLDALQAELPLWTHAAASMLQRVEGDSAVTLARALLAALPDRRDELLAAWQAVLTDAHRAIL